jgi:hypothetical protein
MAIDPGADAALSRKKLRVGVVSERGGINAVKSLFERNKLVVQEYDTRNDYGKDLVIDLTENDEITGAMIAAQVKGGKSYFRGTVPFITARGSDLRLWAESTIPVIGIVWHPESGNLYWTNLTEQCRALIAGYRSQMPAPGHVEKIRVTHPLDQASLPHVVAKMKVFAKAASSDAYLFLIDEDDEVRRDGVFACWTYGRSDARALILLRRMLPYLKDRSFLDGMWALNAIAGNPDHFGHSGNWIPRDVELAAKRHMVWSAEEVAVMVYEHERLDDDRDGWRRGGTGQMLWSLLNPIGLNARPPFRAALEIVVARRQFDAAFRLLVAIQWVADNPVEALREALDSFPELNGHSDVNMLVEYVLDGGRVDIY